MIISIWVIISFLLLPAGSLRYWTTAFVVLLLIVGAGDFIPVRALLAALLGLHVIFVVPAATRSGQRRFLWMALVSAGLLAWLVIGGGVRYWLPALIIAVLVVPFGVPLLWSRPRPDGPDFAPAFEVRFWPRRRAPGDSRPPVSAQSPEEAGPPAAKRRRPRRPEPPAEEEQPPAPDDQQAGPSPAPPPPAPPRNTRSFPPGPRPGGRPAPRPQRQRRPPAAS